MTPSPLAYRIAFASLAHVTTDLARKLLDVVGTEQQFFELSGTELRRITGGRRSRIYQDDYRRQCLQRALAEEQFIREHGIDVTYFTDAAYPRRLLEVPDAPVILYSLGHCDLESKHVVSVVGTRHATPYGLRFCENLVEDLAKALPDLVVVSGLAYGIDVTAHRTALKHNVPTVAVMARGLNHIYPTAHRPEAAAIVKRGGMLVTEYTCQEEVHKGNFLARNRIIAGLSDCTVIVESGIKGGALCTASLAMSYNRDVLAVPGRCGDEFSRGCNHLIRTNQAGLITSADDLMAAMGWHQAQQRKQPVQLSLFPDLDSDSQAVVNTLREMGEAHINQLADKLNIPVGKLTSTLMELTCDNVILALPGCRYTLS